jgi:thioredoxin-dependent peroxiredoxin
LEPQRNHTARNPIPFHPDISRTPLQPRDAGSVLFSHPKDFTPVCTTELGYMARLKSEFDQRKTKIIGYRLLKK